MNDGRFPSGRCSGDKNPAWKGGQYKSRGYVSVWSPIHPAKTGDRRVLAHRLMAELVFGKRLGSDVVVHHKNKKLDDNRSENLQVMTKAEHGLHHGRSAKNIALCRRIAIRSGWLKRRLTFRDAQRIRTLYRQGIKTQVALAVEYKVSRGVIQMIVTGKTYRTQEVLN